MTYLVKMQGYDTILYLNKLKIGKKIKTTTKKTR